MPGSLFAIAYTWNGGTSAWSTTTNWTPNGTPGALDDVTIGSGTAQIDAFADGSVIGTLTVNGTGSVAASGGARSLRVDGNCSLSGTGSFSAGVNKITLTLAAASADATFTCTIAGGMQGNLWINSTFVVYLGSDVTIGGEVDIQAGTFDCNTGPSRNITLGTNWKHTGTYNENTGTVTFTGTGICQETGTFYNLAFNGGSVVTLNTNVLGVLNNCTLNGTLNLNFLDATISGNLTGAGTLVAAGSELINVAGSFTVSNFTRVTSTVTLNGSLAASLGGRTFYNLIISKGAAGDTVTSTGGLTVTNALTLTQGTWAAGGGAYTHTIAGAWNSSAATFTFTAGSSTVTLSSATPSITTKGLGTDPFNNLTLNSGGSMASAVQTNNNLAITGTLALNDFNLTVGGNLTGGALTATAAGAAEEITVAGNWGIAGGSFTRANSRVTFNNAGLTSTISGSHNFNNLRCITAGKTIRVTIGTTQTVSGTFTVTGAAGNLVRLLSTLAGTQWIISSAASAVNYAYVQDSDVAGATNIVANTSTDAGNNKTSGAGGDWVFTPATLVWDGSSSTDWFVEANWDLGYVPGVGDSTTIPNVANDPVLTAAVSVAGVDVTTGILDLAAFNLTVSGTLQVSGAGRLRLQGTQTVSAGTTTFPAGTVEYYGAAVTTGLATGNDYNNLEFTGGTRTLNANLTVNNTAGSNLTVNGAALDLVSFNLTVTGNVVTDATSTLILQGGQTVTIGGTRTYGGTVRYNGGGVYGGLAAGYTYGGLVHINGTGSWTLASPLTAGGGLTIDAGTLTTGGNAVGVTGNLTASGNGVLSAGAATITVTGGNVDFTSNAVNNFTPGTSTLDLQGAASTINAPDETLNNLTVNKGAGATTVILNSIVRLTNGTGALTMTQGTLALSGNTLRLGLDLTLNSGSSATIAIGTGTLDGGTNNHSISITNAAASITQGTGTLSCNNLTQSAGTYTLSGTGALNAAGSVAVTGGTFTESTSVLTMTGNGTTVRFSGVRQPYDLIVNLPLDANTLTISTEALNVGNRVAINNGRLSLGGQNLTVWAAGAPAACLSAGASDALVATASETVTLYGNLDFSAAGNNLVQVTSTFRFYGDGTRSVNATLSAPNETFATVELNKNLATDLLTLSSAVTVSTALNVTRGVLTLGANTLSVNADLSLASAAGTLHLNNAASAFTLGVNDLIVSAGLLNQDVGDVTAGTLTVSGTGTYDATGSGATDSLTVNSGAITVSGGTLTLAGLAVSCVGLQHTAGTINANTAAIGSSGTVAVTTGTFNAGSSSLTMSGAATTIRFTGPNQPFDLTVSAAGPVTINTDDLTVGGALTVNAGATFSTNATTLTVTGAASVLGTLTGSAATDQITVNGGITASGTINLSGGNLTTTNLTVSGTLVALAAETITASGSVDFSNAGNNFTQVNSQVIMQGAATNLSAPQETFYDLSFTAAGTVTLQSAATVGHDLSIGAGTTLAGNNFNLSVGRNWSKNAAGGFTAGTGTVFFTGATTALITGSTTFNNFSCTATGKTLQFTAGSTQTISGTLTVTGAAGAANLISLVSSSLGSPWVLDCASPQTVTFALVRDGNVLTSDITANTSRNDGGNDDTVSPRWIFTPSTLTWTGAVNTTWSVGGNWNNGYPPNTTDNAIIANAGSQPATLAAATTIVNLTINAGASVSTNDLALTVTGFVTGGGSLLGLAGGARS